MPQWLLYVLPGLTLKILRSAHTVASVCSQWVLEQKAIIPSRENTERLLLQQKLRVYCAVRTQSRRDISD